MKRGLFSGRGMLAILAVMLASSGALRMGHGIGAAMALDTGAQAEGATEAAAPLVCPEPPAAVVEALNARAAEVDAREAALEDRLAALDLAEQAIAARMTELEAAEASLKETIALADGAAEKDITNLVAVYEAMKPADAARLFDTMAAEFAAGFLGRMRPDAAAAILAGMTPESAYAVSALIAGRNALAPKD
jgi:flagellar motility protein MotE (MotC chaperone)